MAALRQVHRHVTAISLPDSAALDAAQPILLELSRLQSCGNCRGRQFPTTPVFVFHALFDEMVAYPQAAALRRTWCNEGATVTWATYPVAEHVAGMVEGAPAALDYLSARFAGIPAVGNCLLP